MRVRLQRIDFDGEDERPAEVTVTLSREEALFLAALREHQKRSG